MKVNCFETTKNKVKQYRFTFTPEGKPPLDTFNLSGDDIITELKILKKEKPELFNETLKAIVYTKFDAFEYLNIFPNLEMVSISGSTVLQLTSLSNLKQLKQLYIDRFSKPTNLSGINRIPNLKELWIGTFTFNGPIIIKSFDELIKCSQLEKLGLSYSKFSEEELKRIIELKKLKEFNVHQKIETRTLAYLAAKLPRVNSPEFQAWQEVQYPIDGKNIKINGRRKPYLREKEDAEKIRKYTKEFDKLKTENAL